MVKFTGLKVFSATMPQQRANLGEVATDWIAAFPEYQVVDWLVRQSSDSSFHCLTIILFYVVRP